MERIGEFVSITGVDFEIGEKYMARFDTFEEALEVATVNLNKWPRLDPYGRKASFAHKKIRLFEGVFGDPWQFTRSKARSTIQWGFDTVPSKV